MYIPYNLIFPPLTTTTMPLQACCWSFQQLTWYLSLTAATRFILIDFHSHYYKAVQKKQSYSVATKYFTVV